jgi:hypothetical protein
MFGVSHCFYPNCSCRSGFAAEFPVASSVAIHVNNTFRADSFNRESRRILFEQRSVFEAPLRNLMQMKFELAGK